MDEGKPHFSLVKMLSLAHVKIGWLIKPAHADADIWTQVNRRRFLDKKDDFLRFPQLWGANNEKSITFVSPVGWVFI